MPPTSAYAKSITLIVGTTLKTKHPPARNTEAAIITCSGLTR